MKLPVLNMLYPHLTMRERISLLLAAHLRNDDAEYQHLFRSAPVKTMHLPEHYLSEHMLHILVQQHIRNQLELAGTHFLALFQMVQDDESARADWHLVTNTTAYVFQINTQAWNAFGKQHEIDAIDFIHGNYEGWLLSYCQSHMPSPSHDEVLKLLQHQGFEADELVTVEQVLQQWNMQLQELSHPL